MVLIPRTTRTGSILPERFTAAWANRSLLINPENNGTPTMDSAPTLNAAPAHLSRYAAPVKSTKCLLPPDTSQSPAVATNNRDLVAAWDKI